MVLGLLVLSTTFPMAGYGQKGVFYGTIQFPTTLEMVPNIRVYYAGHKIVCQPNDGAKQITFEIPEQRQRTFFYLLITPDVEFCSPDNTIPFLRLKKDVPYTFYTLELTLVPSKTKKRKLSDPTYDYEWVIKEIDLATLAGGRIPDDTIIVRYHPHYVQGLEGGNVVEFPKIIIKPDIVKLAGSEVKLHEISDKWFLAALNTDTIHAAPQAEFRPSSQAKTILAMCG